MSETHMAPPAAGEERRRLEAELSQCLQDREALPAHDFTGETMNSRAFGRVTVQRQEGHYLCFQAGGKERKFALPGCVLQGFLIPDDPAVAENFRAAEELDRRIDALRKALAAAGPEDDAPYRERAQDLFEGTEGYCLAHCISADFSMSRGIVTQFNKRFGLGKKLRAAYPDYLEQWRQSGRTFDCLPVDRVLNLVTKEKYSQKPTYASLQGALNEMKRLCLETGVRRVAMPKIGCGLDKLEWDAVSQMIRDTFADSGISILVCIRD